MKTSKRDKQTQLTDAPDSQASLKSFLHTIGLILKNMALFPLHVSQYLVKKINQTFKFSLTYKIGLIYTVLTLVTLLLFTAIFALSFRYLWLDGQKVQLKETAHQLAASFEEKGNAEPYSSAMAQSETSDLALVLDNGLIEPIAANQLKLIDVAVADNQSLLVKKGEERYLITTAPFNVGQTPHTLYLIQDLTADSSIIVNQFISAISLLFIVLLIIVYIGSKMTVQLLKPIDEMTAQIKKIGIKNLNVRLDEDRAQDELKSLTMQFNALLDNIEEAYSKQNQFVSDASHELRTPISVIKGYVSMLDRWGKKDPEILQEAIEAIKDETIQMQSLIEKLLFLARSDRNKIDMEVAKVDMTELLHALCKETQMIDHHHAISCQIESPAFIYGNEKLIKQMMRIFIENALKFTKAGGDVVIGLTKIDNKTVLFVKDNGIGIPREELPKLFNRFYKADKSRNKKIGGSGLGLSIAKWIIDQHQATVTIESEVAAGTTVQVYFEDNALSLNAALDNKAPLIT